MMNFAGAAGAGTSFDAIPNGQLAWAIISYRGLKGSKSGGQYLDIELVLDDGQPYARRKVWDKIGDPMFDGNSEQYRQMGQVSIARILEAGRNAGPNNPQGYQIADYSQLDGLRVAVKIKYVPPKDGYDEKNEIAEYLTPNPSSSSNKWFQKLTQGQFNVDPNRAQAQAGGAASGFGAPAAPAQASMPFGGQQTAPQPQQPAQQGWGQGAPQQPTQPQQGFQQPQGQAGVGSAGQSGQQPTSSTGVAPTATAPSNQQPTPPGGYGNQGAPQGQPASPPGASSWLQQANQQANRPGQ